MRTFFKKQSPARIIAVGFATVIFIGSVLLMLPISVRDGVELKYIDSLYTATSAVCVTGLATVDPRATFTVFGQAVLGLLIQTGGLGVTAIGAGFILAVGKKINLKGRNLVKEAMNLAPDNGVKRFVKDIFFTTIIIELVGAILSFTVFVQDFPPLEAAFISIFHSVSSFNNAGFDILGNLNSLGNYTDNYVLNITTAMLIILGGLGFLVIREIIAKKFKWKKLSMNARVVISMSAVLIIAGTVLLKLSENISWLGAFFTSVSTRTAGFATYNIGDFTNAGLMITMALMYIGASPGSTGGGIKTTTFFVLLQGIKSSATNKSEKAFRYSIPSNAFRKSAVIAMLGASIIFVSTLFLCIFEPGVDFVDCLFEMVSAFGTVGLSTGISGALSVSSKVVTIIVMFMGRLGPLTIATLWYFSREERVRLPEGNISIG